jgi:polysaccharide pyruvyl transferase WcaK-like protein
VIRLSEDLPPRDAAEQWLAEVAAAPEPEAKIRQHCWELIVAASADPVLAPAWTGTRPLHVLLVGYNGAGNLGADIRVAELIRQLRHLLRPVPVDVHLVTVGPHLPQSLFGVDGDPDRRVVEERIGDYVPLAIDRLVRQADVVLACEGSLFKSTFSETLSVTMVTALALGARRQRLAVAVGAEAGEMTADLELFVREQLAGLPILARNRRSRERLTGLGLAAEAGADTAWSARTAPVDAAEALLGELGRGSGQPVTVTCPINPFWWPAQLDLARLAALSGPDPLHYGAGFFHADSPDIRARTTAYLDRIATALIRHRERTGSFLVVLGMERLDAPVVAALAGRIPPPVGVLVSGDRPPELIAALLRITDLLVSSRFHAIVLAAGAGRPAVGLSFDERIATLFNDAGARDRLLPVTAEGLDSRLDDALERAWNGRAALAGPTLALAARELKAQARQGLRLRSLLTDAYPSLADRLAPPGNGLPPLNPETARLLRTAEVETGQ